MTNLTGFVNIIKPTGMSSSDVVCKVKKILKTKKVGQLGTLDPAASGVLPVAVGKATKFFDYFLTKDKEYIAVVNFGIETDTLDGFGNITNSNTKVIDFASIKQVIPNFIGKIKQVPPKYSAIKINGKRACDLAREDIAFEIKAREITIFDVQVLRDFGNNMFLFKVHCSAGTYIRTLFSDIAYALGTVSTTSVIIRTKSGRFLMNDAITLDMLVANSKIVEIETLFADYDKIEVNDFIARKLINGVKIEFEVLNVQKNNGEEFFISYKNKTIGLYKVVNKKLETIVFLYEN